MNLFQIDQGFDSILVRLKGTISQRTGHARSRFDSILVRLKVLGVSTGGRISELRFDSILVRLKGGTCLLCRIPPDRFRFHTGSIKRNTFAADNVSVLSFRFHTGSIKRVPRHRTYAFREKFRFHTGSIKSYLNKI